MGWESRFTTGLALTVGLFAREARAQDLFPPLEWSEEEHVRAYSTATTREPPAPKAYEPPAARFGSSGQVVVTDDWVASILSSSFDGSSASAFSASLVTGFDYFVVRNFSVGVDVEFDYANQSGYGADGSLIREVTTSFAGGPRLGFNIPLARMFSFYPRATLGIEWARRTEELLSGDSLSIAGSATGAPNATQTGPWVSLYAPLLFHPKPHFFLGFGPSIFRDFGRAQGGPDVGAERTRIGAGLELGGDWGGTPTPEPVPAPGLRGPTRSFGEAGEFVLTGEIGASAFWTTYDGTGASYSSVAFSPGVDYFVVDRLSVGVEFQAAYSNQRGFDGTTLVTYADTNLNVAPRVGVDIPIGRWFSVYPRVRIYFGYEVQNEQDGISANDNTQNYIGLGAYVPLLMHVAPHLFIGFGPTVTHDLAHSVQYPQASLQNDETTFGAGLTVGGWL
jgi:hypothetical protein